MIKGILGAVAVATVVFAAAPSSAAPRHRVYDEAVYGRPLVIQKRSFLDAGVVVPYMSEQNYVAESTTLGAPYVVRDLLHQRYDAWRADKLSIPGPDRPLVRFETPAFE